MPQESFADLGVSPAVAGALAARKIATPFPVQRLVIPDVLAGRDVLVKSPTGSGKTLAFAVPIADRIEATDPRPSVLVLAPTRELAAQIVEASREVAHARALSIAAVYGGVGIAKQERLAQRAHILVATPGRLLDLLARRSFSLAKVKLLVLDEADRMLDMGFKPDVDRIVKQTPAKRQTLLFSATLEGEVARLAAAYTHDAVRHEYNPPRQPGAAAVRHRFLRVAHEAKVKTLVQELGDSDRGLALVFVRTKRGADRLVKRLGTLDVAAVAMHGDKSQAQREKALARFEAGHVDTLVATDVAARGIDVDDITHVINFDAPEDRDAYVHRTGRTARAGRGGTAVTFVLDDQARDIGKIASDLSLERQFADSGLSYAATPTRRIASSRPSGQRAGAGGRRRYR
jgi:superfamily II DNA/RNA helicase